ncbi:MAG: hypothetical protein GXO66_04475 [Euryarchaeota archaeon]|nr:hypothetical protein [Euryarchaeota archaeon]
MKKGKILSAALAAMLVLSLVPLGYAQPPQVKKVEERYKAAKANYIDAMKMYKSARQDFMKFRGPAKRGEVPFDKLQNFLLRSIDAMVAHIELVKARVDITGALDEEEKAEIIRKLDEHRAYLEEKRVEAEQAENREQLREIARDVRQKWLEVRVEIKKITAKVVISRLDRVLTRGEEIGDRLEVRIEALKEEGQDTSELEALLQEYMEHLSMAREKRDLAAEKLGQISSPEGARGELREVHLLLRESHAHVKDMFRVLKKIAGELRDKEVVVRGFGALFAKGNGTVVIDGRGGVFIAGNGTVTVKVEKGNIRVAGAGEKQEGEDGSVTYSGFGRLKVVGKGIHLEATGENLLLRAVGRGVARFSGEGEWRTMKLATGSWEGEVSYGGEANESS